MWHASGGRGRGGTSRRDAGDAACFGGAYELGHCEAGARRRILPAFGRGGDAGAPSSRIARPGPGRAIGARARKIAAAPRAGLPVPVPGMAAGPGRTARLAPPHAAVRPGAAMQPARPIPPWRHGPAYAQARGRPPVMPWPIQPPHPTRKGEAHANRGDRATLPDPWPSTLAAQGPCFHRGARYTSRSPCHLFPPTPRRPRGHPAALSLARGRVKEAHAVDLLAMGGRRCAPP